MGILELRQPPRPERYISPKGVFMLYNMLRMHMSGKYDVIKYNWTIKVSDKAFNKRRDKYFFQSLSQKYSLAELTTMFTSNLVANQDAWIGEISDADAQVFYREYIGKLMRIDNVYEEDIKSIVYFANKINVSLRDILEYNTNTSTSYIFKLLQSNLISFETFLLIDSFMGIIEQHDSIANDLIWSNYSVKLSAYKKLLLINREDAKLKFISVVQQCKL